MARLPARDSRGRFVTRPKSTARSGPKPARRKAPARSGPVIATPVASDPPVRLALRRAVLPPRLALVAPLPPAPALVRVAGTGPQRRALRRGWNRAPIGWREGSLLRRGLSSAAVLVAVLVPCLWYLCSTRGWM